MNLLKFNDPAPSRLSYKVNRLLYRLWFKIVLITFFLILAGLLAKKFLYNNIDLNAEIRFLSKESSALYKDLTELSISQIVVKGAQEALKKEIIMLIKSAASKGYSTLKAQALREKIEEIKRVKKAFVKFSTDGLVIVDIVERKEVAVFLNNNLYELLDRSGVILSVSKNYDGLSSFPLLVGKDGSKNIQDLLFLVDELGSFRSEVLYFEWVGERRWNVHMKNDLVFKLPENNLSKGLEIMRIFLHKTNKLSKPIVSVDLRNVDKPIIKFRESPSIKNIQKKIERLAG